MSIFKDEYGPKVWVIHLIPVLTLIIVISTIAIIAITGTNIQFSQYKDYCNSYEQQTGQETRYDRPNFSTAVCYVKTRHGWVDVNQLNVNKVE